MKENEKNVNNIKELPGSRFFEKEEFDDIRNPFVDLFTEQLPKQIVLIAIIVVLIIFLFLNLNSIGSFINKVLSTLTPILVGWVLAFIMSPLYNFFLNLFVKNKSSNKKLKKFSRHLATIICTVVLIGFAIGLLFLFIPQLYSSITGFIGKFDNYMVLLKDGVDSIRKGSNNETLNQLFTQIEKAISDNVSNSSSINYNKFFTSIYNGFYLSLKAVINVFIGIVVMIYSLNMGEEFAIGLKRALFALVRKDLAYKILDEVRYTKNVFSGFFVGKILDSLIIGVICYVCCLAMKMPYTPLIALIVGVTNIIPFFGPFIGAIPAFILILLEEPFSLRPFVFLVFILILQQIDGNIIGPKILGDRTGVGSFWVLFSIILFGGLFGFVGMIIAVPVWAVITRLTESIIASKLKDKGYPVSTDVYLKLKEYKLNADASESDSK